MALTFLPADLLIESDTSINDLPAFHAALRDWEDSEAAAVHPVTHTYKRVDLGGGAAFHAADLINGWRLRFPVPGAYQIIGNLNAEILPVAGVFVERKTSAAFTTTTVGSVGGGGGLTPTQDQLLTRLAKIHGLVDGVPAVVTPTSRTAGDVVQTITEVGDQVTVALS